MVWLDYAFALTFAPCCGARSPGSGVAKNCGTAIASALPEQFLSRDSLFVWAIKTYPRYRAVFPTLLAGEPNGHLRVLWLRAQRDAQAWLGNLSQAMRRRSGRPETSARAGWPQPGHGRIGALRPASSATLLT